MLSCGPQNLRMTIWDVGGQTKIRRLWRHYFQGSHALIFVVDSADRDRLGEAREELQALLSEDLLADACVLVYANKSDIRGAMSATELARGLDLSDGKLGRNRRWYIQTSVATTGQGLYEGLDWLSRTLEQQGK
jgi:GTPase SAR1 family protein